MKFLFFIILSVFLLAHSAFAAVTFDAIATSDATFVTSPTVNLTVGGGCTNRLIVAMVAWWASGVDEGSVTGMTIGGSAATFINGVSPLAGGINRRIEMWYRLGVSTGSNTVTATLNNQKDDVTISARSYCGVNQTTALGTSATADNSGSNAGATVNVSSAADELVIDAVMTASAATTITVGAGQTQRLNDTTYVGALLSGASEKTGSGTTTMSWTTDTVDYTGIIAVPLKPAAAGGGPSTRKRLVVVQ